MQKTYTGSCHCGAVRFEADINLSKDTFKMQLLVLHEGAELVNHGHTRRISTTLE